MSRALVASRPPAGPDVDEAEGLGERLSDPYFACPAKDLLRRSTEDASRRLSSPYNCSIIIRT